ncbi:uncharacterized protein LOC123310206 isoform X2 [Coccinella septempunctata]|uniref:uncharacterized protein LOC123310206 isoform X2 n=1 Tax=Coccinella septempunctata TaxID=41139 RepID=UPI001D05F822|nr:uncharacterized protein LOC123310206 isoform X2 [Coccinella septempunctata]
MYRCLFASSNPKMNRRLLSVFFSALVCSTLGHEHLRRHELQSHHERSLGFHHSRINQQQCSFICPVPNPSPEVAKPSESLSLVFIKETNVFALVNTILDVAIVFQIGEPIALITNGKTGVSIVINIDKETVVYFPSGCNDNLWRDQITLVEYLQKLGPLTNVNNWKNGQSFKLTTVTKEVKNIIISIVETLDVEIALRAKSNPDAIISLISVVVNNLLGAKGVLQILLVKLNSSQTLIVGGLLKVVNLVVGLKFLGTKLNGGLQAIIKEDTSVSLLLGENSGLSSLIDLLIQVSANVDLTKVLGDLLKSPEDIFALAVQLDGGIYYGVSGITAVIYNVQLYAAKKISLEALIDILLQVQAVNGHVKITKEVWNNLLNWYFVLAQSQASQYHTDSSWSTLNKFFQDMKDEKLVINGINVSAIINLLISTSGNASLSNVVKILVYLKPVCALNKLIATLYFRLIYFVISGQGLVFIHVLLPDISISINLSSTTSILKQILSSVNVLQIVSYLLRLDIVGAITHLPVLGPILKALDEILKAVGLAAEVTVTSALKAVGSILDDLKNIILFGLGRGGKAPSDSGIAGLSIYGGGLSVSIKTTWSSSVQWSSSSSGSGSSSQGTTASSIGSSGSSSGGISIGGGSSSSKGSSSGSTASPSSPSGGSGSHTGGISIGGGSSSSKGSSSGTTASASSSSGGSGSGGISIGGGSSSSKGSSSGTTPASSSSAGGSAGGSGSHSGGISIGGGSSSSKGSSSGTTAATSGGSAGGSAGGSGSHSGGISIGGGASSSGGSSSGGSGSGSGGISVGGGSSSSGGSSSGGSGSHSGGISVGGNAGSGGGGSSSGGSGSHSGGISVGGNAGSGGWGNANGGSASHSGGISVGGSGSSGGGDKGSNGWSLGNLLGGNGGSTSSHRWTLF